MKRTVSRSKQFMGFLYGLAAGLAFAVFAWGIDAIKLTAAHGAYSFVKFIPGLFICTLSGALVGWLTALVEKPLLGIVLWISNALLYSWLVFWLPIRSAPAIIKIFDTILGEYLQYPFYKSLNQTLWFGFATIALVAFIFGLLENILIDQAIFSTGNVVKAVPLIMVALAFSLVGSSSDSLLNKNLREPLITVDRLIDFAVENIDSEVDPEVARAMHLGSVKTIKHLLPLERTLILSNFDEAIGQVDVLVNFYGKWVKCTTIYNQVTFCKQFMYNVQDMVSYVDTHPRVSMRGGF